MTNIMTLSEEVSAMVAQLRHLELKSDSDDRVIALLKEQNEQQAAELADIRHIRDAEFQKLRHERDIAVRRATEVMAIIESVGKLAIEGIRKIRGDDTPEQMPERPADSRPLSDDSRPLNPMSPEHEQLLPRPMFLDQERIARYRAQ